MHRLQMAIVSVAVAILTAPSAFAQTPIPNAGFENWSGGEPVGWFTSNLVVPGSVTQSSDAHSGSSAIRAKVAELFPGFAYPGFFQVGDSVSDGMAITDRPASLRGFLKFGPVAQEVYYILVSVMSGGTTIGVGDYEDSIPVSSYQEFTVPISYISDETPDSAHIYIGLGSNTEQLSADAWLLVDDLEFSADSAVSCPVAVTGDVNTSGSVNTADIIYLVNSVLKAGPEPVPCRGAADVNCDGQVGTSDIIYLVNSVLKAGAPPCDVCGLIPGTWSCP